MVARSAAGNASDRRGMDRLAAKEATMTFRMGSTQCRQRTYVDWRFVSNGRLNVVVVLKVQNLIVVQVM